MITSPWLSVYNGLLKSVCMFSFKAYIFGTTPETFTGVETGKEQIKIYRGEGLVQLKMS